MDEYGDEEEEEHDDTIVSNELPRAGPSSHSFSRTSDSDENQEEEDEEDDKLAKLPKARLRNFEIVPSNQASTSTLAASTIAGASRGAGRSWTASAALRAEPVAAKPAARPAMRYFSDEYVGFFFQFIRDGVRSEHVLLCARRTFARQQRHEQLALAADKRLQQLKREKQEAEAEAERQKQKMLRANRLEEKLKNDQPSNSERPKQNAGEIIEIDSD